MNVVQKFITTQNFGQLMVTQWKSSRIFPRIHHIAALLQSPRVTVKILSVTPEKFTGRREDERENEKRWR